jgi:hypothetical protein
MFTVDKCLFVYYIICIDIGIELSKNPIIEVINYDMSVYAEFIAMLMFGVYW